MIIILCIVFFTYTKVLALEDEITPQVIKSVDTINDIEDKNFTIEYVKDLNDINNEQNYKFIKLNIGYAIITNNGSISEYQVESNDIPYTFKMKNNIYAGALNYYEGSIDVAKSITSSSVIEELKTKNDKLINRVPVESKRENIQKTTMSSTAYTWYGVKDMERFAKYANYAWINNRRNFPKISDFPENGICGTIVASTLVSYYDDYVDNDYVPSYIRAEHAPRPGNLIYTMYNYIDKKHKMGTLPPMVGDGLENFINIHSVSLYDKQKRIRTTILDTLNPIKEATKHNRPLAVGLLRILGSKYKNHWVVAYRYGDNGRSDWLKFIKCVDNHGKYGINIDVSWSKGTVTIKDY